MIIIYFFEKSAVLTLIIDFYDTIRSLQGERCIYGQFSCYFFCLWYWTWLFILNFKLILRMVETKEKCMSQKTNILFHNKSQTEGGFNGLWPIYYLPYSIWRYTIFIDNFFWSTFFPLSFAIKIAKALKLLL